MEMKNIIENIINNESDYEMNEESASEQKNKLKKQIEQLKSIILQIEWSLEISKFSKTKCVINSQTHSDTGSNEISDIDAHFKFELFKYSGFYCAKYSEKECIFHFSSANKYDEENTFAVQILIDKGKVTLGKWLMPMSVDLKDITSKFPINNLNDVPYFLTTCKHFIDCYFLRQKQFVTLMDIVSHIKHCSLQASLGYTQINLELMGVYNKIEDKYIHIIVYLLYNIGEIRPHKIKVDSMNGAKLNSKSIKGLKDFLACFKKLDLHIAFNTILNKEPFIWSKEEDDDSPLEINNTSSSDSEGYLEEYLPSKSLELSRSQRKVRRKQRTVKKKKTLDSQNTLDSLSFHSPQNKEQEIEEQENEEQEIEEQVENRKRRTRSKSNSGVTKSVPTINKINKKKLKQKKLEFHKSMLDLNTKNNAGPSKVTSSKKKIVYKKKNQPFTSTPIHRTGHGPNLTSSSNTDISNITISSHNFQNIQNRMNIFSPKSNKHKEKDHSESNTPVKLLQTRVKRNIKSAK